MKITVKDFRKAKAVSVSIDEDKVVAAAKAVGVDVSALANLQLTIKDSNGKLYGSCQRVAGDTYRITICVLAKPVYDDGSRYVLNNTLAHELRHVAQHQQLGLAFNLAYKNASKKHGYTNNPYEVEARDFGRLADHTGTKAIAKAGKALGRAIWGIVLGKPKPEAKPAPTMEPGKRDAVPFKALAIGDVKVIRGVVVGRASYLTWTINGKPFQLAAAINAYKAARK